MRLRPVPHDRRRGGTTVSTFQGVLMFALAALAWLALLTHHDPMVSVIDLVRRWFSW